MSEIKLQPIFNQSAPGVWSDMLHVRIMAMRHNYNIELSDDDINRAMSELKKSWEHLSFNFAFGAYDGDKMIGCISGDCQKRTAYIRHLYVLPEYQGQRVGRRLLTSVEAAAALGANKTNLVALSRAEKFYRANGYLALTNTNEYTKSIRLPHCQTVPVFRCTAPVVRACEQFASGFPTVQINDERIPAFVYFDIDSRITGCGAITETGSMICSKNSHRSDWARHCINRSLDSYMDSVMFRNTK